MALQVFVTGATGAIGLAACKALTAAGYQVVGTARTRESGDRLRTLGVTPVQVDLFDRSALIAATRDAGALVHLATSIPTGMSATRRRAWRTNDSLRLKTTASLVAAAEAAGIRRLVFASIALAYPDRGDDWIDERQPIDPPSPVMETAVEAERMLEAFGRRGGEPVCLRFGRLYGPGRASSTFVAAVRSRALPIVGRGDNFVSSIHAEDAGTAVAAAIDVEPGPYNVVDDEPVRQAALMRAIAAALNAPMPRRLPALPARLILGHAARVMSVSQRVSNQRFRQAANWHPRWASGLDGWRQLGALEASPAESTAA